MDNFNEGFLYWIIENKNAVHFKMPKAAIPPLKYQRLYLYFQLWS